jgi:hypothetical protein
MRACRTLPHTSCKQGSESHGCVLPAGQSFVSINHVSVVKSNSKPQRHLSTPAPTVRKVTPGQRRTGAVQAASADQRQAGATPAAPGHSQHAAAQKAAVPQAYILQLQHACNCPAYSAAAQAAPSGTQQGHHPAAAAHTAPTTPEHSSISTMPLQRLCTPPAGPCPAQQGQTQYARARHNRNTCTHTACGTGYAALLPPALAGLAGSPLAQPSLG